ncbi:MAG: two-component system, OmpR family, sensor histidine kinase KdpD [Verrucomicrobia bacterium]|nr:MAG: two-component system, OmpR family, sensor histidine kinase KdpD [Verrucomicrobiota bacterium]
MCPGVGKTYAMLQTARQRVKEGTDVLAGLVESHGRTETAALLEGIRSLPRRTICHRGCALEEFDLDAALADQPALILVDELAHTNAPGSRHAKRYQDVLELLAAGIDVYTTLNVQHIESQVDIVRQISGIAVRETVPDSILDAAHEIQLIDLSVEKLLERMAEGKVYIADRAEQAVQSFFRESNLTALRELALRFTAECVDRDLEDFRRLKRTGSPWKTSARLMVQAGPDPETDSLIRWTRRAATRLNCPWLVVRVEGARELTPSLEELMTRSLALARQLGGEVVSVTGENAAEALLQVARERNVTQLIVGKPKPGWPGFRRRSEVDRILRGSGDIDVCMVRPLTGSVAPEEKAPLQETVPVSLVTECARGLLMVVTIASLGWSVVPLTGSNFVALLFLLVVVIAAHRFQPGPMLFMAGVSTLCWDFLFIPPQFSFSIERREDGLGLAMFFLATAIAGNLTSHLSVRETGERRHLRQTEALLRVTQSAALTAGPIDGLSEALRTINELLRAHTALVVRGEDQTLQTTAHPASTFQPTAKEWGVVGWCFANRQSAGRFTGTLPHSPATWFPLQTATSVMGVLGLKLPAQSHLDFPTRQTVEAFALQLALVLEKEHLIRAMNQAEVLAQSERLHRTLLGSVSHELETPLTTIQTAVRGLAADGWKNPLLTEIQDASQRLKRVVNGLLQMTRLESEVLRPRYEFCSLHNLIQIARDAAGEALVSHPVEVILSETFPLLKLDRALLSQGLANILHNAAIYTPPLSPIEVRATLQNDQLRLSVRDHGPGLPKGEEEKIFGKFYRAAGAPPGGTGLGLTIARGFVQAQGGEITARTHPDGGAEFVIQIPLRDDRE